MLYVASLHNHAIVASGMYNIILLKQKIYLLMKLEELYAHIY